MDISLDFARTLIEGDQLARAGRHEQAQVVYLSLGRLPGLDSTERALAESRLQRVQALLDDGSGVEVVTREAEPVPPSDEARAEALANDGDLAGAVAIYAQIVAAAPDNALAQERLGELRAQLAPAEPAVEPEIEIDDEQPLDLVLDDAVESAAEAVQQAVATVTDWRGELPEDPVAMLELLLERVRAHRRQPVVH